jgi:hypothetical protein
MVFGVLAGVAVAAPISGTLAIAGTDQILITADDIDFGPFGGGTGNFLVTGGTESFSVIPAGTLGLIADLNRTDQPPGDPGFTTGAGILPDFVVVPAGGGPGSFHFDLSEILIGSAPSCNFPGGPFPAVGFTCSPTEIVPNTPFTLQQNSGSVSVSMVMRGTVTEVGNPDSSPYTGLLQFGFTALNQNTVQELLTAFTSGGSVQTSWRADFTATPIPEPGTFLFGVGALLVVGGRYLGKRVRG